MTSKTRYPLFKALLISIIIALPFYYIFVITPLLSRFVIASIESNTQRPALHIAKMITEEVGNNLSTESLSHGFKKSVEGYLQNFEIIKLKIFALDGTTIFSTQKEDIGEVYPNAVFWKKIRAGETYSSLIKPSSTSIEDESFDQSVLESYYPIKNNAQLVIGAIELYSSVEKQQQALERLSRKLNLMVAFILLLMGAAFIFANTKEKKHRLEQQKSQKQILKAKIEWEKTFDAIEDTITILDADLKIKRINKSGRERYNASFAELLNQKCYKAFENSKEMCQGCPVTAVISEGKTHYFEKHNPKLGKTFGVSMAPIFNEFGKTDGFVHISRDITHQRLMENKMVSNQKMESLANLTGGIAHNFRNILARILANSQLIESHQNSDQEITEITGWIAEAVQAGSKLVNSLVQFSLPLGHKSDFEKIDLAQLIPIAQELISSAIPKNIFLTTEIPESAIVKGNASALLQVLTNIAANAVDAMPDGGDLTIRLITINESANIMITDTGPGIEESIRGKIFEPFFSTKEIDQGTGLGLSSSYGIIAEHGGDIKVESANKSGATFTIILPLLENVVAESPLHSLQDIEIMGRRVLLVDDDEQAITPMLKLLEMAGYHPQGATNCQEALKKFVSWHPGVVILDYNMPGTNGIDCAVELHQLNPDMQAIILTGSTTSDLNKIVNERELGFIFACLGKPIGIKELSTVLKSCHKQLKNEDIDRF